MTDTTNTKIWNKLKHFLQFDEDIDPSIFNNYIKNAYIHDINDKKCYIVVDSFFAKEILKKNLTIKIEFLLKKITKEKLIVAFLELSEVNKTEKLIQLQKNNNIEKNKKNFLFCNFVKGQSNNEAYQAAIAITIELGKQWNPLFIYGNSGLGKTHLLHAIENEVTKKYINKKIAYLSSEEFGRMIPDVLKQSSSNIEKFKNSFNDFDVLLVDDIQFLAHRSKTNEIFFHIFNSFVNHDKQIVISSDKSPEDLYGFEERNISRFHSGLTVGIDSPDFETSLSILKEKIKSLSYDPSIFTEETLVFLANNFNTDVRKLEGSLNRLIFYSILYIKPNTLITINDVMKAFKNNSSTTKEKLTAKKIKKVVSDYFNIPVKLLNSNSRIKSVTQARHIAMYLIKDLLNDSFVNVGQEFGGKDHTTIISAYNKVKKNVETVYEFKKTIENLKRDCMKTNN